MKAPTAFLLAALALATARPGASPMRQPEPALRLADMGMGSLGPELGGSDDDMDLSDPGHLPNEPNMFFDDRSHIPREPDMYVQDPGHIPREPNMFFDDRSHVPREPDMNVSPQQDLDRNDYIY